MRMHRINMQTGITEGLGDEKLPYLDRDVMNARTLRKILSLCLSGLAIFATPIIVPAKEIFVSKSGNDASVGSRQMPLQSIHKATQIMTPGDIITVLPGEYHIHQAIRIANKNGSKEKPFFIRGQGNVILKSIGEGVPGIWRGIVEVDESSYIHISNLSVENSSFFGFRIQNSSNISIEGNKTAKTLSSGIYARESNSVWINNNDVSQFCNRGEYGASPTVQCQEGISIAGVKNFSVLRNKVHDARQVESANPGGGEGIDIKNGSSDGVIAFNRVDNLIQVGLYIDGWKNGVKNLYIHSNRIKNTYMGLAVSSEAGGIVENVLIFNNIIEDSGVDGINLTGIKSTSGGDGLRSKISIFNNTIVSSGVATSKPPFYSRWSRTPFPDWGFGIRAQTKNLDKIAIFDNIIYKSSTAAISLADRGSSLTRFESNLIWPAQNHPDAYRSDSNIFENPGFVAPEARNWKLGANSPAIGRGKRRSIASKDADDKPRNGALSDLGAFAY